jgi:hypothetical protein
MLEAGEECVHFSKRFAMLRLEGFDRTYPIGRRFLLTTGVGGL